MRTARQELPASLQTLIAARLDSLDPGLKSLLSDAAVIGEVFEAKALSRDSGHGHLRVDRCLVELVTRDFLRRVPPAPDAPLAKYAFQHALTREVAYGQLPRAVRLRLHERLGRWLCAIDIDGRRSPARTI